MGKIVAIGGGSFVNKDTEAILKHIRSLCDSEKPNMLFLPTASYDKEDDFYVLKRKFESMGCTVTQLLLTDERLADDEIRDAILSSDIVYVGGGNLKFLMDTWKKRSADIYLKQAFERGAVLSGSSSGAMCWFEKGYDDCGENGEYIFVDCLGLLPFCNCPHFENKNWRKFRFAARQLDIPSIAVENRCAFSYCDGEVRIIKSHLLRKAYILNNADGCRLHNLSKKKYKAKLKAQMKCCDMGS